MSHAFCSTGMELIRIIAMPVAVINRLPPKANRRSAHGIALAVGLNDRPPVVRTCRSMPLTDVVGARRGRIHGGEATALDGVSY